MPFIAVAGLRNGPFEFEREYDTYEAAVEGLADAYEMLGRRKARLRREGFLELESLNGAWHCRVLKSWDRERGDVHGSVIPQI
jgi:hypothetical protein